MRALIIVVALAACGNKAAQQNQGSGGSAGATAAGSATAGSAAAGSAAAGSAAAGSAAAGSATAGSAAAGSAAAGSAAAGPATASSAAAGSATAGSTAAGSAAGAGSANVNITANQICCCESTGDATHETIEGEPEACTADDMNGSCVALSECGIDNSITRLEVDTPVTVDSALLAIWKTKDPKAYGALRIKIAGKHAKLEVDGSNGEGFTKAATLPTTGAIVVTAKADGTAEVSNGATTWLLSQEYRYLSIKVRKRK